MVVLRFLVTFKYDDLTIFSKTDARLSPCSELVWNDNNKKKRTHIL